MLWSMVRNRWLPLLLAAACSSSGGTGPASPSQPSARWLPGMVYDAARQQVLMFGGTGAQAYRDLWAWDGQQWTLLSNNAGPPARDGAVMAYDPTTQRVLLWGGRAANGTTRLSDTWVWDGATWTQANASGVGGYEHAAGGFDDHRGQFVVFTTAAGQSAPGQQETWEWDGQQQWLQRATIGAASFTVPLASPLVFEPTRQGLLGLFGDAAGGASTQLWLWSGIAWSSLGAGPSIDPGGPLVATGANALLAFAGEGTGAGRTWGWDGTSWAQVATTGPSAPRFVPGMAFDARRNRVVLFGGFTGAGYLADTWEWDGTQWSHIPPL